MLPRTALGYLGSSMYYPELEADCDDAILEFIDTTKGRGYPCRRFSALIRLHLPGNRGRLKALCIYMEQKAFQRSKEILFEMRKRGITVSPNVKPGILLSHPGLAEMKKQDIFVKDSEINEPGIGTWWGGKGVFVDFTKPAARVVWKDMLKSRSWSWGPVLCGTITANMTAWLIKTAAVILRETGLLSAR